MSVNNPDKRKVEQLEEEIATLKDEKAKLAVALLKLEKQVQTLSFENKSLLSEIDGYQTDIERQMTSMREVQAHNYDLIEQLTLIEKSMDEQTNSNLAEQLEYSQKQVASLQSQLSTTLEVCSERSDQLLEANLELKAQVESLKIENAEFKNNYQQLKVRFEDSVGQLSHVDEDLVDAQTRLRDVQEELRKARKHNEEIEHELDLLNQLEQQHRDELEELKLGKVAETELVANAEIDHARTVIQQLRAENSKLKAELDEKIADLESQVTEYRLKFNFAQQQLAAQKQVSE